MNGNTKKAIAQREASIGDLRQHIEFLKTNMTVDSVRTYMITEALGTIAALQIQIAMLQQDK